MCSAPSDRPSGFPCTQQLLLEAQTSLHGDSSSEIRISLQETFPVSAEKKKKTTVHIACRHRAALKDPQTFQRRVEGFAQVVDEEE